MSRLRNKYVVTREDGTVPEWPYLVLAAEDPAAPFALLAYASAAKHNEMDEEYVEEIKALAAEFRAWIDEHGAGDPGGHVLWRRLSKEERYAALLSADAAVLADDDVDDEDAAIVDGEGRPETREEQAREARRAVAARRRNREDGVT